MKRWEKFEPLTAGEQSAWDEDGYVLLRNVFSAPEVQRILAAADRLEDRCRGLELSSGEAFERVNIIEDDDTFLNLIDHPRILGAAIDLMGAAIHLLVSTITFRPSLSVPAIRWHTDDPSPYFFPRINGMCPVWQVKIAIYLTDILESDMGNFVAAAGSHQIGFPPIEERWRGVLSKDRYRSVPEIVTAVPDARQVTAQAGDVLLFHPALWHTVAPNHSGRTRKNIWFVYGPLWMRLGDRIASDPALIERCDPIRRQLLGATVGGQRSYLAPHDEGAPLIRACEGQGYEEIWQRSLEELLTEWWSSASARKRGT